MDRFHMILTGMEPEYMKKLALYLKTRRKEICEVSIRQEDGDSEGGRRADSLEGCSAVIVAGREEAVEQEAGLLPESRPHVRIIFEEEPERESGNRVFAYQSADLISRKILSLAGKLREQTPAVSVSMKSRWTLILTTGCKGEMLPFAAACAQMLSKQGETLLLNLSGISGMRGLLGLEGRGDLTDLILALRKREQSPEEYTLRVGDISVILPPVNPSVLYEMTQEDMGRLIRSVEEAELYRNVVVILGDYLQGTPELFRLCERLICLLSPQRIPRLMREELFAFYRSAGGEESKWKDYLFQMPEITGSGEHLIYEWEQGTLGTMIREAGLLEELSRKQENGRME